jgi:DNA-binding response OmpR family regulator
VLVVDDDKDLRDLFAVALKSAGFQVRVADDGISALQLIELTPPDVIVLDLMLPMLDGASVRQEMSAHANTRHIPVVIVTGSTLDLTHLGVAATLRKPVEPGTLITAVRSVLAPAPADPGAAGAEIPASGNPIAATANKSP